MPGGVVSAARPVRRGLFFCLVEMDRTGLVPNVPGDELLAAWESRETSVRDQPGGAEGDAGRGEGHGERSQARRCLSS